MSVRVASLHPPPIIIILSWLFFVALPTTFIWSIWTNGIAWEEHRHGELRRNLLSQELQAFARELELPILIERHAERLIDSLWHRQLESQTDISRLSPEVLSRLHQRLNLGLPFPVAAMVWHDQDTRDCRISTSRYFDIQLPKRGLLQLMAQANGQIRRRPVSGNIPAWQKQLAGLSEAQETNLMRGLGNTLFGDVIRARLRPRRDTVMLSRLFGGGRLHAYYQPFYADSSSSSPVLGGCLLLIRERDVDPDRLCRWIARTPLHAGFRRTVRLHPPKPVVGTASETFPIFRSDAVGDHLEGRPENWFLALANARGTIRSMADASRFVLRVTCPSSNRRSPLRTWLPTLELLIQIAFLGGTVFFLRLAFFGFGLPLRLRGKLLIGAMLALGVPLGLLLPNLVFQQRLQQDRIRETVETRLRSQQYLIERLYQSYLAELRLDLLHRAESLRSQAGDPLSLGSALAAAFAGLPVRDMFAVATNGTAFHWAPPNTPARDCSAMERTALLAMAQAFRLGSDPRTRTERPIVKVHGISMNLTPVGDLLARPGTLLTSDMLAGESITVSGLPIPLATSAAALLVRFRPEHLLKDFFSRHTEVLTSAIEESDAWSLSLGAVRIDSDGAPRIVDAYWEPKLGFLERVAPLIDRPLRLGLNVNRQDFDDTSVSRMLTSYVLPGFPCLLVGYAESTAHSSRWLLWLGIAFYAAFLLGFIILLLESVFRRPILFFHAAALEIEAGRYPVQPPVSGGDELGQLGDAFGAMIEGLRQRDAMSRFVSDEVIQAVQADSEEGLKPGGELMPVTILFAGLRGFKGEAARLPAAERLSIMNAFLELVGRELKTYGGSLDKMIEDTLMGVFRPRAGGENSTVRAVRAAFALQQSLNAVWNRNGIACDVGIAHGTVLSGRIGSHHGTLDFSVIGNAVNLAARLKAAAKSAHTTGILIDPQAIHQSRGLVRVSFLERREIKGRSRAFNLYEAIGLRDETPES